MQGTHESMVADVMNARETQKYLKMSSTRLWQVIKEGKLKAYKDGNRLRVFKDDAIEYLRSLPPARSAGQGRAA